MNASVLRRCVHMACFVLFMASICFCNQCEKTTSEDYVIINSTEVFVDVMEYVCQVYHFPLVLESGSDYYPDYSNNGYDILRIDILYSDIITDRAFQNDHGVNVAEIHLENHNVKELSSLAFASLSYLQKIYLSRNDLTNIKNGTFNIPSLEVLDLSMNKINSFTSFCLVGTNNLRILNLSSNFLQIFEVLPSISSHHLNLDLSHNALNYVQFENVTGIMESLNVTYNSLTVMKDCFPAFSVINLSNNELRSIRNASCSSTPEEIYYINIGSNFLSELEEGVFDGMSKLKYLYLDQNNLTSFPARIFAELISLEFLNVSHNHIEQLDDGTFDHLKKLFTLDMSCNKISEVKSVEFAKMSSLRILYLNQNNLNSLPSQIFAGLNSLTFLNVSHNHLMQFHDGTFDHLETLVSLDMSYNHISELKSGTFAKLYNLRYLNLDHNKLGSFSSGLFPTLNKLRVLNISQNHLKDVYSGSFDHLGSLINLDLSYNDISNIQFGSLEHLENLVNLDLSHNQISNIKGRLRRLTLLEVLNIEFNQLYNLDTEELFTHSQNLKNVLLNGNEFSCEGLIRILESLASRRIVVPNGHSRLVDNIQGIRCSVNSWQ